MRRRANDELTQRIVESEAFRAINLLIDQKAAALAQAISGFRARVDAVYSSEGKAGVAAVSVRVSCEPGGRTARRLAAEPVFLKDLAGHLQEIERLDREVGDLQRFKLRLLNDYDFTSGDDSQQRAVFVHQQSTPETKP